MVILSQKSRNATKKVFVNSSSRREEYKYYNIYSFISYSIVMNNIAIIKQY